VYIVMGLIVGSVAKGNRSERPSTRGAIGAIADHPYGKILLVIVIFGLACYVLACVLGAVRGYGGKNAGESDTKDRLLDAGRAVINGGLAFAASRALVGDRSKTKGGRTEKRATSTVLDWPLGRPLVVGAGLVVVGGAVSQFRKAMKRSFLKGLSLEKMSEQTRKAVEVFGMAGHAARGVVYLATGLFLAQAGLRHDANEADGIDGALLRVARASYGPPLLWLVAVGLVAFGLWSIVEGRFRQPTG